jgi:hypothetical protein
VKTTDNACLPVFTEAERARAHYLVSPQKPPANTGSEPVWPLVMHDYASMSPNGPAHRMLLAMMHARDRFGYEKYGVRLTHDNGRDYLADGAQEALDLAAYLKAAMANRAGHGSKLQKLYEHALEAAFELRLMIAYRDGELPR